MSCSSGRASDKARRVAGDLAVDPGLVLGHSSIDSREIGLSTAISKTHHSSLDPLGVVFIDHGAPRVPLHTSDVSVSLKIPVNR